MLELSFQQGQNLSINLPCTFWQPRPKGPALHLHYTGAQGWPLFSLGDRALLHKPVLPPPTDLQWSWYHTHSPFPLTQNAAHRIFLLMWEGFWALFFLGSSEAGILPWWHLSCSEGSDWDEVVEAHRGGRCPSSPSWACSGSHMPSRDGSEEGRKKKERKKVLLLGWGSADGLWYQTHLVQTSTTH